MDMRMLVILHPDLRPVVEYVADRLERSVLQFATEAVREYRDDSSIGIAEKPDEEWSRWADEALADPEAHQVFGSLDRDLSVFLVDRGKDDGVHYLRILDRAVRRYNDRHIIDPAQERPRSH